MRFGFLFVVVALMATSQAQLFERDEDGSGWGDEDGSGMEPEARLCTCDEVEQCESTVVADIPTCWSTCRERLSDYLPGNDTKLEDCFPNMGDEVQKINKCVRARLSGFCAAGKGADPAFDAISQVTGAPPFAANTTDTVTTPGPLVRKARAVFENFRKFQVCFAKCVKESAVSCHQQKGCAVNFPSVEEFTDAVKDCRPKEWRNYFNVRRACQCLAFRQHAKALVGKCILLGNQFFMRNL